MSWYETMIVILSVVAAYFVTQAATAAVPLPRYEALMKQQSSQEIGLYDHNDKVVILTETNFNASVLEKNRSSLVEFYNSYCGHCKRFAPTYKDIAKDLFNWRDVLLVSAIDCAADENNDICRQYEVMGYPTIRYMPPGFKPSDKNYGERIDSQIPKVIRMELAKNLAAEPRNANMTSWPNFQPLAVADKHAMFEGLGSQKRYIAVIYEAENSTLVLETALDLLQWPSVQVRRVQDADIATEFQIGADGHKIALIDRKGSVTPLTAPTEETSKAYAESIEKFLRTQHLTERPITERTSSTTAAAEHNAEEAEIHAKTISEVHRNKHIVYQADLELAIRGMLHNEISKVADISGERLLALQRFLGVLKRYNPLGTNGHQLVQKLNEFVVQFNQHFSGAEFERELERLTADLEPIFSANHFVGCSGSKPGLRGFTCSLWQLFHYMTIQATRSEVATDPIEVLQAMHGYVKYFFGCTECSEHFQTMATRRKIWSIPNKDEAVLWLWAAHNEVNQRLAGDTTEDPEFPKIQFPSPSSCSQCYKQPVMSPASLDISWDKDAVLGFLKNIYNSQYISRYGLQREDVLEPSLEKLRQKRMISNVFSDMDMRMGMLLYGFCIVMMIIAFKLFAFKGYRKKPYGHDILGKV